MLYVYVLTGIAGIIVLRFVYLIVKRLALIGKIKNICKKNGSSFKKLSPTVKSVFLRGKSIDFCIDEKIYVKILAVPTKKCRCHFETDKVEIYKTANQQFLVNKQSPGANITSVKTEKKVRTYGFSFEGFDKLPDGATKVIMFYPAPNEISAADAKYELLGNGDTLHGDVLLFDKNHFLSFIENI